MRGGVWLGVLAIGTVLASACGEDDSTKTKNTRPMGSGGSARGSTGGTGGTKMGAAAAAGEDGAGSSAMAARSGGGSGRGSGGSTTGGMSGIGAESSEAGANAESGAPGSGRGGSGGTSSGRGGSAASAGDAGAGAGMAGEAGAAGSPEGPSCLPPADPSPAVAAIPTPDLYWRFDDADVTASVLNDRGPNDYDGTMSGNVTTGSPGLIGQAFTFDGATSYVTAPASTSALKTTPISVSAWINVPAHVSAGGVFMSLGHGAVPYTGFIVEVRTTDQVMFGTEGGLSTQEVPVFGCMAFGRWVHYVVVFADSTLTLYRDGVDVYTASANFDSITYGSYPVVAGRHPFFMNRYFAGRLDELAVWNQALTPAEVLSIWWAGQQGTSLAP